MNNLKFTDDWFSARIPCWDIIFSSMPSLKNFLEIGSYEGRSACYTILKAPENSNITCIDIWSNPEVEKKFDENVNVVLENSNKNIKFTKIKSNSKFALIKMLSEGGAGQLDFIYIDGSHSSQDVLYDALLSFDLLKVGGVLIFDDYLWFNPRHCSSIHDTPKPAIDSFLNIFRERVEIISGLPLYQMYIIKRS